jgi:hypothetical protein
MALEKAMSLRSLLAATLLVLALPAGAQTPSALDACLIETYTAHRRIARDFQMQRAAILAEAVPDAWAVIEANRDLELANNDRLELAFRHLLATDRKQIDVTGDVNTWVSLSPDMSAAIAAKNAAFVAASKRAQDALARQTAAGSMAKVREAAGAMATDPSSRLALAIKAASEAIVRNGQRSCQ